jgi:hypothetical protein
MPGELAKGSEAQRGSKQSHVDAARVGGKNPYLIWGGLDVFFSEPEVSRGHSSRRGNVRPGRIAKAIYRAKGRTDRELSRRKQDDVGNRHLIKIGRVE